MSQLDCLITWTDSGFPLLAGSPDAFLSFQNHLVLPCFLVAIFVRVALSLKELPPRQDILDLCSCQNMMVMHTGSCRVHE